MRRSLPTLAWYFMRVSGLLLTVAITFHMYWNTVVYEDIDLTWELIARRYMNPGWRLFDWGILAFSVLHGFYGLKQVLDDHLRPGAKRVAVMSLFHAVWIGLIAFGTYVIFSFPWRPA